MEPITKGEAVTLDDNKEYYVVDIVYDEGKKYIYLITDEEENKVVIGEEIVENKEVFIETISDPDIMKRVMEKIASTNK